MHRHCCPVCTPPQGWTPIGKDAANFTNTLSEPRARTLKTRGVLMVQIPIAAPQIPTGGWRWLSSPPDPALDDLTWVIDGSRKYATSWTLSTTGCGVAVLNAEGALIAYATATPPAWVRTAGAAEAWALLLTLRHNPFIPDILTDCMSLLHAAKAGPLAAAAAKNTDARIWSQITDVTGGCYKELAQRLVWMPAHTSATESETRVKSNGKGLTTTEWRANQLADALAKKGASCSALRAAADKLIKAAGNALLQSAARLGVVTLAANNHVTETINEHGVKIRIVKRDSSAVPAETALAQTHRKETKAAALESKQAKAPAPPAAAAPLVPPTLPQAQARKRKQDEARRRSTEATHLSAALATAVASASTSCKPQTITAAERLEALRRRRGL